MKKKIETWKITWTGILIGIGILLPYVTAHLWGIKGTVFLPMHYSIFITGTVCGPLCGMIAAIATPVLSSVLTGMPQIFPMLPVMVCELLVYGCLTSVLQRRIKNIYGTLLLSMAAGRLVHGLVFALLMHFSGAPVTFSTAAFFVVEGIPGTVAQLVLLPPVIHFLGRIHPKNADSRYSSVQKSDEDRSRMAKQIHDQGDTSKKTKMQSPEEQNTTEAIGQAKQMIREEECSFVVIQKGRIVYQDKGNGVKPIMKLLDSQKELLRDAVIVDKLIGKAAALLLCLGEVKYVYGITMSEAGKAYLDQAGVAAACDKCIGMISNRKRDGICPLERAVSDIEDPQTAYDTLKETIAQLMKTAG